MPLIDDLDRVRNLTGPIPPVDFLRSESNLIEAIQKNADETLDEFAKAIPGPWTLNYSPGTAENHAVWRLWPPHGFDRELFALVTLLPRPKGTDRDPVNWNNNRGKPYVWTLKKDLAALISWANDFSVTIEPHSIDKARLQLTEKRDQANRLLNALP